MCIRDSPRSPPSGRPAGQQSSRSSCVAGTCHLRSQTCTDSVAQQASGELGGWRASELVHS
eukprot:7721298-Alexandrium_andersonii.AAC.1